MAIKKNIEIDVNASAAEKEVDNLIEQFGDLGKAANKSIKNIEKGVEDTEKSTKSLADGFKGVGLAIKAMGIGLIIGALSTLKEVFMGNQKVADTFSTVMGTVANVFSQVTNVVVSVIEKVGSASNGFEGLKKVIGGLLTLGLTPLKLAFYGIKLTIDEVRLAWEESVFGDGDPKTIKKLTERINETKTSLKEVGTDAVNAGKQVANNIGKAVTEVGAVIEGTVDGVSKISVSAAYEQAKANVQLQNTAKLAEANQARLVEQYDRQAEKLRQVRDEERNSVEDRIKANNQLKVVLENQQRAMLAQADAQIAAAQSTLAQNKSIENQVAVTNALANREGVLAQIEGLRSEQKANDLALNKELIDLTKTKQEAETQLAINEKNFNAERIKDEQAQLEAKKQALEQNKLIELERLQNVIDSTKAGTQARVDAENEYALKKQEIDQQIILAEDAIREYKLNKEKERVEKEAELEQQRVAQKQAALDAILGLVNAESAVGRAALIAKQVLNAKEMIMEARKTLTFSSMAAAKSSAAVAEGTAQTAKIGFPQNIPMLIAYAAQAVGIFSAIRQAVSKSKAAAAQAGAGGSGGDVGSAPTVGGGSAPQFNVVGNSGVNQIAQTLGSQQPVQAYVVANQVTTQQALDRNIVNNASLG